MGGVLKQWSRPTKHFNVRQTKRWNTLILSYEKKVPFKNQVFCQQKYRGTGIRYKVEKVPTLPVQKKYRGTIVLGTAHLWAWRFLQIGWYWKSLHNKPVNRQILDGICWFLKNLPIFIFLREYTLCYNYVHESQ